MDEISSLILQMKESGLSVDTKHIEDALLSITSLLNSHESSIARLPQMESSYNNLRRDLNTIRIALEESTKSNGENRYQEDDNVVSDYGVRALDIEPIRLKHTKNTTQSADKVVAKSMHEMKSAIRKLQQGQDEGLVSSMQVDESVQALRNRFFEIQQKLVSSASMQQLQTLQQSLTAKIGQLEQHLQDIQTNFQTETNESISKNLEQMQDWFKDLEAMVKQRQVKLEQRLEACAKEYDVEAFRESIESDVAALIRNTSFLDDTAKAQGKTLVLLQQKIAIVLFFRHYTNWKHNQLKSGLSKWKQIPSNQKQYEINKDAQKRAVRKLLTNIMSRRKQYGFSKWVQFRDWQRKNEEQKLKAASLICDQLGLYLSASKATALNQWRRITLMDQLKCSRRDAVVAEDQDDTTSTNDSILSTSIIKLPLNLESAMKSFGSDVKGANYALAQEIECIKSQDLVTLRQDYNNENQRLTLTIRTNLDTAIERVETAASTFQSAITERVDKCVIDLPVLHSKLTELSELFESNKEHLLSIEASHTQRIDALSDQEQQLEQRLSLVEELAKTSARDVASLFEEQTISNESIQSLRDIIGKNESRQEEERNLFQQALNHFGDELLKTKITLGHTQVRCETMEKDLADTTAELSLLQHSCQTVNDTTQRQINHPGIARPSLERIVGVGHAYESLAQEKNYVTGINVMATLRNNSSVNMKSSDNVLTYEEEVDVPSEIVAFAHDYAAWIAYQADHESLLRLIAGGNIEDQVYAEDDMISRRKDLCSELKSELTVLLEQASSECDNKKSDPSSTTRGLGLRWEARAIFLTKLVASLEAALTKHDQILLPAATRLGRVRPLSANVTICVACDRPMRTKTARTPADGEKRKKKPEQGEDSMVVDKEAEEQSELGDLDVRALCSSKIGEFDSLYLPRSSTSAPSTKPMTTRLASSHKENSEPTPNSVSNFIVN